MNKIQNIWRRKSKNWEKTTLSYLSRSILWRRSTSRKDWQRNSWLSIKSRKSRLRSPKNSNKMQQDNHQFPIRLTKSEHKLRGWKAKLRRKKMRFRKSRLKIIDWMKLMQNLLRKKKDLRNKLSKLLNLRKKKSNNKTRERLNLKQKSMKPEIELTSRKSRLLMQRRRKVLF